MTRRQAAGRRCRPERGPGRWRVTARLELDDPPHLSADDYAGLILLGAVSIHGPMLSLHTLVHTSIPARVLP